MNQNLYQMLAPEESLRIVIRRNPDGSFLLGVSTGKFNPLLCSGTPEAIDAELEARLPEYRRRLREQEIEAKLAGVHEDRTDGDDGEEEEETTPPPAVPAAAKKEEEQAELDFGF